MSNYKRATLDEDEVSEAPAEATASPDSLEVSHMAHLLAALHTSDANISLSVCCVVQQVQQKQHATSLTVFLSWITCNI